MSPLGCLIHVLNGDRKGRTMYIVLFTLYYVTFGNKAKYIQVLSKLNFYWQFITVDRWKEATDRNTLYFEWGGYLCQMSLNFTLTINTIYYI